MPAQDLNFDQAALIDSLLAFSTEQLDALHFGIIGFDSEGIVQRYNRWESEAAGLALGQVMGLNLFGVVAQCMNNYLVAQRFEDAAETAQPLDETIDYLLTLRMRPVRVKLRLLQAPGAALRFVCIDRRS